MLTRATRSLEASSDGAKLIMSNTGGVPAQKWRIRAISAGLFRFTMACTARLDRSTPATTASTIRS